VLEVLDAYEESVRHNPDDEPTWADDAAWLAVVEEAMTRSE